MNSFSFPPLTEIDWTQEQHKTQCQFCLYSDMVMLILSEWERKREDNHEEWWKQREEKRVN